MSLLLLDTHVLLRTSDRPLTLPEPLQAGIGDASNTVAFSPVALWEIVIKAARLRRGSGVEPRLFRRSLLDAGYRDIAATSEHAIAVGGLPPLHKDPFDRLMIAQAAVEGAALLTDGTAMARYGRPVRLIG